MPEYRVAVPMSAYFKGTPHAQHAIASEDGAVDLWTIRDFVFYSLDLVFLLTATPLPSLPCHVIIQACVTASILIASMIMQMRCSHSWVHYGWPSHSHLAAGH